MSTWVDRTGVVREHSRNSAKSQARKNWRRRKTPFRVWTPSAKWLEEWLPAAKLDLHQCFRPGEVISVTRFAECGSGGFFTLSRTQAWRLLHLLALYGEVEYLGRRYRGGSFRRKKDPG